jgi:hypothetical protein
MVLPLAERDETKINKMVGHEKIHEKVVGDLLVVRPAFG